MFSFFHHQCSQTKPESPDCKLAINTGERNWLILVGQGLWLVWVLIWIFWKDANHFYKKKQMSPRFSGKSVHLRCYGYEFISLQHLFFHDQSSQMRQEGQGLTGNWSSGQLPVSSRYSLRTVQNNTISCGRLVVSLIIAGMVAGARTLGKTEKKTFL